MNDRSARRYFLASLALTLAPSGCGALLGLDDFTEGPGTGTGGGGAGGVAGSSSGMETATTGSTGGGMGTTSAGTGGMSSSSTGMGGEATSSSTSANSSSTGGGCAPGDTMSCYTGPANTLGKGECTAGMATCLGNGMYGACMGDVVPKTEICNLPGDENCDGISCSEAVWAKIFGDTSNYHEFYSTAIDSLGNILTAGVFTGSLKFGNLPALVSGGQDYFLAKLDSAGNPLWSKQFGDATNNGAVISVAVDKNGNAVIAGGLNGTANFGAGSTVNQGGIDIFVAKYDPSGNYKWGTTFGSTANETANSLAIDSQGDVIIAGSLSGTLSFGGATFTAGGNQADAFLTKLASANGAHVWSKHFAEASMQVNSNQGINRIATDPADYIQVVGSFNKSADFGGAPFTTASTQAVVVARYDSAGNHSWSQAFSGSSQISSTRIASDAAGNLLVTADLSGSVDFGGGTIMAQGIYTNVCIVKFDATGAHKWSKVFADGGYDHVADISADASNNVIVTGYMGGTPDFGGGALSSGGANDAFLAKLDAAGAHFWSKSFGDSGAQVGSTVDADPSTSEVVMSGTALGTIDFGTGALTPSAGTDMYGGATLAKFQP